MAFGYILEEVKNCFEDIILIVILALLVQRTVFIIVNCFDHFLIKKIFCFSHEFFNRDFFYTKQLMTRSLVSFDRFHCWK